MIYSGSIWLFNTLDPRHIKHSSQSMTLSLFFPLSHSRSATRASSHSTPAWMYLGHAALSLSWRMRPTTCSLAFNLEPHILYLCVPALSRALARPPWLRSQQTSQVGVEKCEEEQGSNENLTFSSSRVYKCYRSFLCCNYTDVKLRIKCIGPLSDGVMCTMLDYVPITTWPKVFIPSDLPIIAVH